MSGAGLYPGDSSLLHQRYFFFISFFILFFFHFFSFRGCLCGRDRRTLVVFNCIFSLYTIMENVVIVMRWIWMAAGREREGAGILPSMPYGCKHLA